jgi:peptidoglycan/LPS O-acetylase OafA/YrhL
VLLVLNRGGGSFKEWWRFGTFSQSFFADTVATVDGPMWSLVVEVQFYVLLPLLAYGIALVARGRRGVAAALIAGAGLVSAAIWWMKVHESTSTDLRWRYSLPATFLGFVPGMLLALWRLDLEDRPQVRLPSSTAMIATGVALWVVASRRLDLAEPITAAASLLVLAGVVLPARAGVLARALDLRVLGLLGVASYSLYLWHLPIVDSLGRRTGFSLLELLPLALVVCVAVAAASYLAVERPFLRLRSRWGSTVATQAPRGEDGS